MTAIVGKLSFDARETLARPALEQMLGALQHRGYVGQALHVEQGLALGWCGDESAPINHPAVAASEDLQVRAVCDSALTNSVALRVELEARGHVVRGRRDADLLVHAYEEWGDSCVERLEGPFACAVWDSAKRRLLLARDHVGVRPLFFAVLHGHGVVFASEIAALLQDPGVDRDWCPQAIDAYLALGYVPSPLTVYQRISKLEPGQRLVVDGRRLHVERFWQVPAADLTLSGPAVTDSLDALLREAVRAELQDGKVTGTLYSGGLASSSLLALAPHRGGAVVSVADDATPAEIARAHAAAVHLGFQPHVEVATPDIAVVAPLLASHFDEPIADPAAVTQYSMFVAARQHGDCALTGHGAALLWPMGGAVAGRHSTSLLDLLLSGSRATRGSFGAAAAPGTPLWADDIRRAIYTRGFAWQVRDAHPFSRYVDPDTARQQANAAAGCCAVIPSALPDGVVATAQQAAAAAGLQLRLPFLSRPIVELAARVPERLRYRLARAAHPLRTIVAGALPSALLPPPAAGAVHAWLRPAVTTMVPSILLAPRFDSRGIVSRPAVRQLWDEHRSGRRDHSHRLWSLLMLEFWFREYIDGDVSEEPAEYAVLRAA